MENRLFWFIFLRKLSKIRYVTKYRSSWAISRGDDHVRTDNFAICNTGRLFSYFRYSGGATMQFSKGRDSQRQ